MSPILLIGLLGFFGLILFGILLVCVGLTLAPEAHGESNEGIIGSARGSERATQRSNLHAAIRSAAMLDLAGIALVVTGILGFFWAS